MTKLKLLILEPAQSVFSSQQLEKISEKFSVVHKFGDFRNGEFSELDYDEEITLAIDPDSVNWNLDNAFLSKFKNLNALHIPTTNFSWVDLDYLNSKNISFSIVQKYSTDSVAEFALAMMLMITKKLPLIEQNGNIKDFTTPFIGQNIEGKTAGIIGLGNIGTKIAKLMKSLGLKVLYYSKNSRNEQFEFTSIEDLFSKSDFIFPCCAANIETSKLISDDLIKSLNKHQSVVAISKGYFNHELILERAKKGEIYGYAFDFEDPIIKHSGNILSLPHYGWYTNQSLELNAKIWFSNIMGIK
jgi:lactate dehydrogenase-like 2-hydroxyacid dehydrogenase